MGIVRVTLSELKRLSGGILPKLVLLSMACIPLLYGGIYLYANWDPYGSVDDVPAAIVMLDSGSTDANGNYQKVGQDVEKNLKDSADFQWQDVATRDEAVQKVTDGDLQFALVIPQDFTKNLQSTSEIKPDADGKVKNLDPESAGIEVITNDANNYILTNIVKTAGTTIRDSVAQQVGDKTADTMLASFTQIHSNISDAADGADQLNAGSIQLKDGIDQLKDGSSQLSDGTITLKDGTVQLRDGSGQLVDGQQKLADGSSQLASGADQLSQGASDANDGAKKLADGSSQLYDGTKKLSDGADSLASGTSDLADGASTLATGTQDLSTGAGALASGTKDLSDGAGQLAAGTSQLNQKLNESGLNTVASDLNQVCTDISQNKSTGDAGAKLTDQVTTQIAQQFTQQVQPLVADGTLTQQQADQLVATLTSQQTKDDVTAVNNKVIDDVDARLEQLGSSCATDGTSAVATKITDLTGAVSQINDGAQSVAQGASDAHDGAQKLSDGSTQLNDGAQKLSQGADSARDGAKQLADGAQEVEDNTGKLSEGAATLADGTQKLADGSSTLAASAHQLADGEQTALEGQKNLNDGAIKLDDGATSLKDGASELDSGIGQAQSGAGDLQDGSGELATGLSDGVKKIPSLTDSQQRDTAETMSNPVDLNRTSLASGENYGEGMGPFFMVLALWIGALMLVQTMRPKNTRALASNANSVRLAIGAWGPFGVVGILQAFLLYLVVDKALGFNFAHPVMVFFFLLLVSLVYTAVIYGLVALLDAPGKLLGLIILIIQLVTAGGMMPYQTLPDPIRWLHFVLPMGYALGGVRRLAYGIDLGALPVIIAMLLLWGFIGLFLGYLGTRKNRTWTLKTLNPEIAV